VVDDVPIIMSDTSSVGVIPHWNNAVVHLGPTIRELVSAIESGATSEVLMDCLEFPRKYPLQGRLTGAGIWPVKAGERAGLAHTRAGLRKLIAGRFSKRTQASDVFNFFHHRRSGNDPHLAEYMTNRFTMPRYLSAMSLAQRLPASDRPVLDIACGFGHFAHYFTKRSRATPAVGVDLNFYQAWGAKKWVAPDGWFVCCDASKPLPLKSDSCSGVTCSDAFMLLPEKRMIVDEVERVAPGRPAVYARVGNRQVGPPNPPHGGEMTPDEYWDLFGRGNSRYFADVALWKDYLMRRNPLDSGPVPLQDLRWEKYLTYVVHPEKLGEGESGWAHGVGHLRLNPALTIKQDLPDALVTEFMFKSAWMAYEDADMMAYTERGSTISKADLRRAFNEPDGKTAESLLGRFILVGLPDAYIPAVEQVEVAA
jgi:SAM-dependent methyltransferase